LIGPLLNFTLRLTFFVSGLLLVHLLILWLLGKHLFDHFILPSYLFNYFITLIFFAVLLMNLKTKDAFLGWLFFITSGLKFLAFFIMIYPLYNLDGAIQKAELFTFFLPYSLCLTIEIHQIIKILNTNS
jgi:hypothetical protein